MVLKEPCSHQGKHRQHDQGVPTQAPQAPQNSQAPQTQLLLLVAFC